MNPHFTKINKLLNKLPGQVAVRIQDISGENTFEYHPTDQLWAASVVKIPIACEFFRQVHESKIDPQTKTQISQENMVEGTGVLKLIDPQQEYRLVDLVTLMLAVSDNAATNQLVDVMGWEHVEQYMQELGLTNTTFRHKMFIKAGRGPNLTTARDITQLLIKLYNLELPGSEQILHMLKKQQDRRYMPVHLPNDVEIAHKTGSMPEGVHDVGIVYTKRPFIFSFLSDDQKNKILTVETAALCARIAYEFFNS